MDVIELNDVKSKIKNATVYLFVTATDIETEKLHNYLRPIQDETTLSIVIKGNLTYFVGILGLHHVVHVQCSMGTAGRDSSLTTISEAIDCWKPCAVVMVGIAFGKDRKSQKIGDVLVSESIVNYESQRVSTDKNVTRSPIPQSGKVLFNRFKYNKEWDFALSEDKKSTKHFGLILTGEKLIDNNDFKDELFSFYPTAIGGEMEAFGVYSACSTKKIDEWIIVKGICDWADGNKNRNKAKNQAIAAEAAVSLCQAVFQFKVIDTVEEGNENVLQKPVLDLVIDTQDMIFEVKKILNEKKADRSYLVEVLEKCINYGELETVESICKLMTDKDVDDISFLYRAKIKYYKEGVMEASSITDFICLCKDNSLINNLLGFCCCNAGLKESIPVLLLHVTDIELLKFATMLIENRVSEFYNQTDESGVLTISMKEEFSNSFVALQIVAHHFSEEMIINVYQFYEQLNAMKYHFYNHFLQLVYESLYLLTYGDVESNAQVKEKISKNYGLINQNHAHLSQFNEKIKRTYFKILLTITGILGIKDEFMKLKTEADDNLQDNTEITGLYYYYCIENSIDFDKIDFFKYAITPDRYNLLVNYLARKSHKDVIAFFNDYKYLLKEQILFLSIYINAIKRESSESDAVNEMKKYKETYSENIIYNLMEYEHSIEPADNIECFIDRLKNEKVSLDFIERISNLLGKNKKYNDAIEFVKKYEHFYWRFKQVLAELLFTNKEYENCIIKIDELLDNGDKNGRLYELKAHCCMHCGRTQESIKLFEKSFNADNTNSSVIINILGLRYENYKIVNDLILHRAEDIEDENVQHIVALTYNKLNDKAKMKMHLTRSLLLCSEYNESIFGSYMKETVGTKYHEKVDYETVDVNTAVFLEDISTKEVMIICIYDDSIKFGSSNFANAIHIGKDDPTLTPKSFIPYKILGS